MSELCNICPRRCNALRPEVREDGGVSIPGLCGLPMHPVVARAGLHFWEEPVISGPQGSGTVFFSGCNLQCVFCQNYNISSMREGIQITPERLREIYFELIGLGAHNINLVTPQHFSEAILQSLAEPLPVPVVYNTNGYDSVETLRRFDGKVQIYLPDLKYADNTLGIRYSGVKDYCERAREAILEMFRQTGPYQLDENGLLKSGVVIRHLLLPGHVKDTIQVIKWVAENFKPGDILFSLMRQYMPCGRVSDTEFPEINRRVTYKEYCRVRDALLNSGITDGYFQGGDAASGQFIPVFDGTGVSREEKL